MRSICSTLALAPLIAICQGWFPDGASWYHSYASGFGAFGHIHMQVTGDTLIQGQVAHKLQRTRVYTDVITGTNYTDHLPTLAAHESDGLVMLHAPVVATFDTLYHMNAVPGDRWHLPRLPDWRVCADDSYLLVVDTGSLILNDIPLRWLAVEIQLLMENEVGWPPAIPDTIIERIGITGTYFLAHDFCNGFVDAHEAGRFRCYSDADISYQLDPSISCDHITGISEQRPAPGSFHVWPNPGSEMPWVERPEGMRGPLTLQVRDARGALIGTWTMNGYTLQVDAEQWPPGLYLIELTDGKYRRAVAKWMKE